MPQNITDAIAWTNPIQTIAANEGATATNFALAPQGLANRTAYLAATKTTATTLAASGGAALVGATNGAIISGGTVAAQLSAIYSRFMAYRGLVSVSGGTIPSIALSSTATVVLGTITHPVGAFIEVFLAAHTVGASLYGTTPMTLSVKDVATSAIECSSIRYLDTGTATAQWHACGQAIAGSSFITLAVGGGGAIGGAITGSETQFFLKVY